MGVAFDKLSLFYVANIRSALTYCIPAFYSMLTDSQITSLEKFQKLCTKVILPHVDEYLERLAILHFPELAIFSENLYRNHFIKIIE